MKDDSEVCAVIDEQQGGEARGNDLPWLREDCEVSALNAQMDGIRTALRVNDNVKPGFLALSVVRYVSDAKFNKRIKRLRPQAWRHPFQP